MNKNEQSKSSEHIIVELVADIYDKLLNMQAQIFKLEEMLYQNHALDREQVDRLMPENIQKNIPEPPKFEDF